MALDRQPSSLKRQATMGGSSKDLSKPGLSKRSSQGSFKLGEEAGMGRPLDNQPTAEMRADLEKAGIDIPDGEQLVALSHKFSEWLGDYRFNTGKDNHGWASLFKELDVDGSGDVTFDELMKVVRQKLEVKSTRMGDNVLKALWCALDVDDSNKCTADEIAAFFKLAEKDDAEHGRKPGLKRQATSFSTQGAGNTKDKELAQMGRALDCEPTIEMRKQIEESGLSIPDDGALLALSHKFTEWISEYRYNMGLDSHGWKNLFAEIDEDGSGFVTFDELEDSVRHKLKIAKAKISEVSLKGLWCALDVDDSNQVTGEEMARFFRMAEKDKDYKGPGLKRQATSFSTKGAGDDKMKQLSQLNAQLESQPTTEMKVELAAAGVALPTDEELTPIAENLVNWIEDYKHNENLPPSMSWANLFRTLDEDGSGFVSYDELVKVFRSRLKVDKKMMSDTQLKALWCVLDADESNQVQADEMAGFFRRGAKVLKERRAKSSKSFSTKGAGENTLAEMARLGENLEAKPTKEIRAELDAKGIPLPEEQEVDDLSIKMFVWLEEYRYNEGKTQSHSWVNLFKDFDADGSGYVTYDEFMDVIRHKLKVTAKMLPQDTIDALWCHLDADESNQVQADEMSKFFRRADSERKLLKRQSSSFSTKGAGNEKAKELAQLNQVIESQQTTELRAELEEAGVALPDEETLTKLAVQMMEWLEDYRYKERLGDQTSWHILFKTIDQDGSGFVTYDELCNVLRVTLGIKKKLLSDDTIKGLWCSLDADNSNQLQPDEMAKFFKRGEKANKEAAKKKTLKKQFSTQGAGSGKANEIAKLGQTLQSTPTIEMREELEKEDIELPDQAQLVELSKNFTKWLEDYRHKERLGESKGWAILFRTIDVDGSGYVTYDELKDVVRGKLKVSKKMMPETTMKALWCTLDADNSNQVMADEMSKFLRLSDAKSMLQKEKSEARLKIARPTTREGGSRAQSAESPKGKEPLLNEEELAAAKKKEAEKKKEPKEPYVPLERPLVPPVGKGLPQKPSLVRRKLMAAVFSPDGRVQSPHRQTEAQLLLSEYNAKYKRRMLNEMRQKLLSTPIPDDNGGRIGGGRVLPLYESERLIEKMEARDNTLAQWQWPSRSSVSRVGKRRPSTLQPVDSSSRPRTSSFFVEFVGRDEVMPTPTRPSSAARSRLQSRLGSSQSMPVF